MFGDGVNVASRIQTAGTPGAVLMSERLHSEIRNHPGIKTKSIGKLRLKNVTDPVEVFVVTNEGLTVPHTRPKIRTARKYLHYAPLVLLAGAIGWFINKGSFKPIAPFSKETISVPSFANLTGDTTMDHVGEMAAHWITKELSVSSNAQVLSSESGTEMIKLAGIQLGSETGRKKYAALTGAVNIVDASFTYSGSHRDSFIMSGFIKNLQSGKTIQSLDDVECKSTDPLECIKAMSNQIKGYWESRSDKMLTPPNYEAYKAFLAARKAWYSKDHAYVASQLNKSISLDSGFMDPYFLFIQYYLNGYRFKPAYDTLQSLGTRFKELDERQSNLMMYFTAELNGNKENAHEYFLKEYEIDRNDLFVNTGIMAHAIKYLNKPRDALKYFNDIPIDSLPIENCHYCIERLVLAMWSALDIDSTSLMDSLAVRLKKSLYTRNGYGALLMYEVEKKDTLEINRLLRQARSDRNLDYNWNYLVYITARMFQLQNDTVLASHYGKQALALYQNVHPLMAARTHYLLGQWNNALKEYKKLPAQNQQHPTVIAEVAAIYAKTGEVEKVKKAIKELEAAKHLYDFGETEYFIGRLYALLGEAETASNWLATSLQNGKQYYLWESFQHDPDLMSLWNYPGYKELLTRFY